MTANISGLKPPWKRCEAVGFALTVPTMRRVWRFRVGSVEPPFGTLRRDLWEDIFRADCLHLVGSEVGWGVYEEGQWSGDTAGVVP